MRRSAVPALHLPGLEAHDRVLDWLSGQDVACLHTHGAVHDTEQTAKLFCAIANA